MLVEATNLRDIKTAFVVDDWDLRSLAKCLSKQLSKEPRFGFMEVVNFPNSTGSSCAW